MFMLVTAPHGIHIEGYVAPGFERVRDAFVENFTRRHELGGGCCRLSSWREGRRPVGRHSKQADRRALGAGHDGHRLLGDEGPCRDDARPRPFPRVARLRGAGRGVLAGVRAERQGAHHRQAAAGAPGRLVCPRRASRPQRRRRPRSPGGRAGASEAGMGARHAAGVSRQSRSATTRESCCAASIRGIAASDSSSRTRSPRRSGWTSTSGSLRRSRTRAWRRPRRPRRWRCCAAFRSASRWTRSTRTRRLSGRSGVPSCRSTSNASTRATSRFRRAAPSARPGRSREPTACSPPAGGSSGCARRRWTCWPLRRFRLPVGSTTNA